MRIQNRKVGFIRKHSILLALLTLLSYFYIAQTSIQTKHTHFYPNGVVITHSHPMHSEEEGEPASHHHHSKSEIVFFNNLQFHFYTISEPLTIQVVSIDVCRDHYIGNDIVKHGSEYLKIDPRGPPLG